mgnify:CR=1 FL=1
MNLSIGVIAKEVGVTPQTLREWEKESLIPQANRQFINRWRVWNAEDLELIKRVAEEHRQARKREANDDQD